MSNAQGTAVLCGCFTIICNPVVRPVGSGTGMVRIGSPPKLAGEVSRKIRERLVNVHSAFVSAPNGVAAMIKKS